MINKNKEKAVFSGLFIFQIFYVYQTHVIKNDI